MLITKEQLDNFGVWISALRSGKFPQGKKYLKLSGRYCCIGVGCEVMNQQVELSYADGVPKGLPSDEFMEKYFGLGGLSLVLITPMNILSYMNDGVWEKANFVNYTFNQIADLLEQYVESILIEYEVELEFQLTQSRQDVS